MSTYQQAFEQPVKPTSTVPAQPASTVQVYSQQPAPMVYQTYPNAGFYNPPPKEDPNVACMWVQYLIGTIGSVILYGCLQSEFVWLANYTVAVAKRMPIPLYMRTDPMGLVPCTDSYFMTFFIGSFIGFLIFAVMVWNGMCCAFGGCGCAGMSTSARVPKTLFQITGYFLILAMIGAVASLIGSVVIILIITAHRYNF